VAILREFQQALNLLPVINFKYYNILEIASQLQSVNYSLAAGSGIKKARLLFEQPG
jgi:hypothetical protein